MSVKDDIPAIFLDKLSPRGLETIQKCKEFVDDYCLPGDKLHAQQMSNDPVMRWKVIPEIPRIGSLEHVFVQTLPRGPRVYQFGVRVDGTIFGTVICGTGGH